MKNYLILLFVTIILGGLTTKAKAENQPIVGANMITNSTFDTDATGWGSYFDYFWDPSSPLAAKGSLSVVEKDGFTGKAFKVSIQNAGTANYSIQIAYPMPLVSGVKYQIKFKASADAARIVAINLQQDVNPKTNWFLSDYIGLTTTPTAYGPFYFTATETDPSNLFKLYLGGGGTENAIAAYFDDIEVAEVIEVDTTPIIGANIITNGTFDIDAAGWGSYFDYFWDPTNSLAAKGSLSVVTKDGFTGNAYKVSIQNAGTANYSVQIAYPMPLESSVKYQIKFKASADAPRNVAINLQQDVNPKTNWFLSDDIGLTTTPTTYGPFFFTGTETDPSNLFKLYLGGGGTENAIAAYFDDVEVAEVIDAVGVTVPDAPTMVKATAGNTLAMVEFTAPINTGGLPIRFYTVTSSPEGVTAKGASSPIKVAGLTNRKAYSFTVTAANALGISSASGISNSVTPAFQVTNYYVSSLIGSDENDGKSATTPFKSIKNASKNAIPGDTISIMNGTYVPFTISKPGELSGTASRPPATDPRGTQGDVS